MGVGIFHLIIFVRISAYSDEQQLSITRCPPTQNVPEECIKASNSEKKRPWRSNFSQDSIIFPLNTNVYKYIMDEMIMQMIKQIIFLKKNVCLKFCKVKLNYIK